MSNGSGPKTVFKKTLFGDIEETKRNIEKYEQQLQTTIEKDNSRNVQVIIDFLDEWKKRVYEFYDSNLQEYYQERETLTNLYRSMYQFNYGTPEYNASKEVYEAARLALYRKTNGVFELREVMNYWTKRMEKVSVKVSEGKWEFLKHYIDRGSKEDAYEKLEKDLEAERKRKYDFIIERTNKIVGEIMDAAGLTITSGELNGIIIGTKGKARVTTFALSLLKTDGAMLYNAPLLPSNTTFIPLKSIPFETKKSSYFFTSPFLYSYFPSISKGCIRLLINPLSTLSSSLSESL